LAPSESRKSRQLLKKSGLILSSFGFTCFVDKKSF